jgi:hypothetical protein
MLLLGLIGNRDLAKLWWDVPNRAFAMQCPRDVPEDKVKDYLEGHCYG